MNVDRENLIKAQQAAALLAADLAELALSSDPNLAATASREADSVRALSQRLGRALSPAETTDRRLLRGWYDADNQAFYLDETRATFAREGGNQVIEMQEIQE